MGLTPEMLGRIKKRKRTEPEFNKNKTEFKNFFFEFKTCVVCDIYHCDSSFLLD